jgi:transcriptional regulator with XRE-family HTH domain
MSSKSATLPEWSVQILRLLSHHKLSQAGLAVRLGVSPATVTRWIKGTHEPTSRAYVAMGNLAGPPEGGYFWERAGVDAANFPDSGRTTLSSLQVDLKDFKLVSGRKLSKSAVEQNAAAVILPLLNITAYGDRVPPGPHVTLSQAKTVDVLMAPLSWCPHPEKMLCLHLSGDSMQPVIPEGSVIAVDTAVTERAELNKKLVVFSHRDLGFKVARLQRLASSDILISANHNCLPVDVSNAAKWKAIGAVVWWVMRDQVPQDPQKNAPATGK